MRCGYSSTTNAIQSLEGFEYCQYALTIGQYFVLSLLLRFLAFSMLSVIVMIIATWIRNRALAFCVGLLILGSQYVLSNVTYVNPDSPLKNLNVITFTDVSPLFIRLRACNFAGMVCPYAPLAFIVCTGLAVLMFVLFGVVFVNQQPGVAKHHRNTDTLPSLIANRKKTWQMVRISPSGLFIAEFFKILIASGMLSVLLLSVAGKYVVVQYKYQDWNSVSDRVYYEYMSELQGPMTDQKLLRIQMEREKIDSIIANYQWKQQEFVEGSITSSEYAKYLQEFEYAQSKDGYLAVIEEKRDRLLSEISKGREGWFIYDTGWLKLVHSGIDILLMLTISLLACQAFSMEYRSKYSCDSFNTILRATPYGRSKTFFAKFIVVLIIATMVFIVFSVIEVMTIVSRYVLPAADAPLSSLVGYEALPTSLTVGSYNIILLVAKWILCLLLALDLFSLSCLLRQGMYALVIGVAVAALVGILNHLFGTYVIVYIAILLLPLTTILIIASYRKFIA